MKLHINGKDVTVNNDIETVTDLLTHFQLQHKIVIVEQNKSIINKEDYNETKVLEGDSFEIVNFVGGG